MAIITNTTHGVIEYSDEVIADIAGVATTECYGVVGMASKRVSDGLWELLKKENLGRGVKTSLEENSIKIELYIIVEYGTKISTIASNVIQKVKYTVESLTGLNVSDILVNVQGIRV